MKHRLTGAVIARLEDEIDAAEGLAALADIEGTITLAACFKSRKAVAGRAEYL